MIKILKTRLHQGYRTMKFPAEVPGLPERYRGRLVVDAQKCTTGCSACVAACPTQAIELETRNQKLGTRVDLGRCIFCSECVAACPTGAIAHTRDHRMATSTREALRVTGAEIELAHGMAEKLRQTLGRALRLRQVSAGGCAACELDTNVLNTVGWDLSRFGIQFVASPRHADGLLVTGAIPHNMHYALLDCYAATPDPKIVIALGACAISGGPYRDTGVTHNGVTDLLPVDLFVPGCPPHPLTILDGLVRLLGKVPAGG